MVDGVGCLWIYKNKHRTFDKAVAECQRWGGDVFEFADIDVQFPTVEEYLLSNGSK